jgi:predicted MFS family arabinose efflux permease
MTAKPARSERTILLTLAAVQFTHILDYMIMMPLGGGLMRQFNLAPAQFSHLVAAYGGSAALAGLFGGLFLDRVDRKRALIALYLGFALATLACALSPTHHALLAARVAAGVCGGLAEWLGWDPTLVRILYTVLTIFTIFSGAIVYLILWIIMPKKSFGPTES